MNFLAGLLLISPLVGASHSPGSLSLREESVCTDTHIFLARGLNDPYPGRQGIFVNKTIAALTSASISSDYEDILYYSTFQAVYCDSISEGVANGISQIIAYNKRCPDAKLVVSGYSQGAFIVGDIFGGGGGPFEDCVQKSNEGLDVESDAGKMVTAILVWGSKRHTASQPYNTFSGAEINGPYPRPVSEIDALRKWTPVLRDYCVITDPNCAAGGTVIADHLNYFELYSDQAVEWIKNQVENNVTAVSSAAGSSNTTITSSTTSSSPTLPSSTLSSPTSSSTTSSETPSATSQTVSSGTSAPSSGSAATTHYQRNLLALAIAVSLAVCI